MRLSPERVEIIAYRVIRDLVRDGLTEDLYRQYYREEFDRHRPVR